jgi:hypothetical protein
MRFLRFNTVVLIGVIAVSLLALAGCSREPDKREDDVAAVRAVMELRAQAIANKDIAAYEALFHPEYNDGRHSREEVIGSMNAAFENYDAMIFHYPKTTVELKMNTARIIQRIRYEFGEGIKDAHDHEHLMMRFSDGKWSISGGVSVGIP